MEKTLTEKDKSILNKYYFKIDHYAGLGNVNKLHKATGISKQKINKYLQGQDAYTFHKYVKKRFPTKYYHVTNIDDLWESDKHIKQY